ncbi:GDSL-type esterase/lipase family protein [Demequina sp. NBRC 110053]|uniref:GDSL-type esterase/lipase family protein n=1 Tax=Demequina sp. NBRC 110053 TaxID=1570342 RepID=UPI0009FF6306|nr:GDSL-type esterase/lipase family protein [Demequina sp. NBRC 110053]
MARGPVVAAIGDSLTLGVGDGTQHPRGDVGWAAHTARAVGASRFVNVAANGVRARDLSASQLQRALACEPDIVLMSAGGNDVLRGDFDPGEVERELEAALHAVSAPDRCVVVLGIDRIGLFDALPRAVTSVMARRVAAVNAAIVAAASRTTATLVDGGAVFHVTGRRAWHIDRIHPSPLGHRMLAAAAVAELAARWPQRVAISPAPAPPGLTDRAWWLVRNGAPWTLRRSRDLLPQVTRMVTHELLEDRRSRLSKAARA